MCPHCVLAGLGAALAAIPSLRYLKTKVGMKYRQSAMVENFGILYGKKEK